MPLTTLLFRGQLYTVIILKTSVKLLLARFGSHMVAQRLKRLPAMWETWVRSLGREDLLEKEMANPLQYSCLENPTDRGAWRATVHVVTQSRS